MSTNETSLALRRARVSELSLDGLSLAKIAATIHAEGFQGRNGGVLSKQSIKDDLDKVISGWVEDAAFKLERHRATHLALLTNLYRKMLDRDDLRGALQAVALMIKLMGTEMPQRVTVEGGDKPVMVALLPVGLYEEMR